MRHPTKDETFRASELVSPDMLPLDGEEEVWVVLDSESNGDDVDDALREHRQPLMTRTETGVKTTCTICGTAITLEFGELTKPEALDVIAHFDNGPRECPGFHVELSGFRKWWRMDAAVEFYFQATAEGGS